MSHKVHITANASTRVTSDPVTNSTEDCRHETDNLSALESQSNRRMLYFSDGVMEELSTSDSEGEEGDVPDKSLDVKINPHELPLGPRLRYKAGKMGTNILAGIDYVGSGLASFLGITTPKYASELEYYKRAKENDEAIADEDNDNWQGNGNANNNNMRNADNRNEVIVLCEPRARNNAQTATDGVK